MAQTILVPGVRIGGKYDVVEVIGFGGMGVVYKVREQVGAVGRTRALKTVLPQYASDPAIVTRFRQEAEKMCLLEHENIVPVLSYSEEGDFPYLIMPFLEGQTLKEYLAEHLSKHGRPLPLAEVLEIGIEIARGLEIAHGFVDPETGRPQPMIHRDIKPGNVMVRPETRGGQRRLKVMIMDFGIAKVLSGEDTGHSLTDVIGTVKYASPEQIRRGKDIDPRADIYSLGMVLYELCSGRHMFTGMTEHAVLVRMIQKDAADIDAPFPDDTPDSFRELVRKAVALDREQRYASVADMAAGLRRILDDEAQRAGVASDRARDDAAARRAAAVEAEAPSLAADEFAEAEAGMAAADAAAAGRDYLAAERAYGAAAMAFDRAASAAAQGRRRARLEEALRALPALREEAREVEAERLATPEWSAAERARQEAEAALEQGDLSRLSRAVAEAERSFREAQAKAADERRRGAAETARRAFESALGEERSRLAAVPEPLRAAIRSPLFDAAERAASASEQAFAKSEYEGAAAHAEQGLSLVRRAAADRDARAASRAREAAAAAARGLGEIEALGAGEVAAESLASVRRAVESAVGTEATGDAARACVELEAALERIEALRRETHERLAATRSALDGALAARTESLRALSEELGGDDAETDRLLAVLQSGRDRTAVVGLEANRATQGLVDEADRRLAALEREIARRRERAAAESERDRASEALGAAAGAVGDEPSGGLVAARKGFDAGLEYFRGQRFAEARLAFTETTTAARAVVSEVERQRKDRRLAALRERLDRLRARLDAVPSSRALRRSRKRASECVGTAAAAVGRDDETEAAARLAEAEPLLAALEHEAAEEAARPPAPFPWRAVAGVGGAALAAGAVAVLWISRDEPRPEPPAVAALPAATAAPRSTSPVERAAPTPAPAATPVAEARATAVPEPTAAPRVEPTVAIVVAAPTAPRPEPTAPALALAGARPSGRSLELRAGDEQRFEIRVRSGDVAGVEWRLDGRPVARGAAWSLGKPATREAGKRVVEAVDSRSSEAIVLRRWDVEVTPPPLEFASLEPRARSLERTSGSRVDFRAPVAAAGTGDFAFEWQVNGRPASGSDGPAYAFETEDPGRYVVSVRAVAPWGASIENRWSVTVKPKPPPPVVPTAAPERPVARADARTEAQSWIDDYCGAFERKDTKRLLELGHLSNESEAGRLREALSVMNDLEIRCTNPSVAVDGDRATVSFDRSDRWTDPSGGSMSRPATRITKQLHRVDGRWVASP